MATIFLTGFPGFLGSALIERLLVRHPHEITITCLIQAKFRALAEERVQQIAGSANRRSQRIRLVEGDITLPDLGLGEQANALRKKTIEIFHLAAVYDLGVQRQLAMRVNVEGTRHVLALAHDCPNLQHFHYMSTCYVSGSYPGLFGEDDLSKSQTFNNHYEETKYLAELDVQLAMRNGLPVTIYRPSIVTGDSRTGATQKYDGPYYFIRWILRQKAVALLPVVGNIRRLRVNVVPRDYVIDALDYLSGRKTSKGKVYHLCDPRPLTVEEMIESIGDATGRRIVRIPLPKSLAKGALLYVPRMESTMGIEPQSVDYFVLPTTYTCDNTLAALQGTGIACPTFDAYVGNLVDFMRRHPQISSRAMA